VDTSETVVGDVVTTVLDRLAAAGWIDPRRPAVTPAAGAGAA
jgi:hypothetical protein